MARPANITRPYKLTTTLPEDLMGRLFLHLHSPVEGGVPHGAIAGFLSARIREYLDGEVIALTPEERSHILSKARAGELPVSLLEKLR